MTDYSQAGEQSAVLAAFDGRESPGRYLGVR